MTIKEQVRRFITLWLCDANFRSAIRHDPKAAAVDRGLDIDPNELRIFWDDEYREQLNALPRDEALRGIAPLGHECIAFRDLRRAYKTKMHSESRPMHAAFAQWRDRQIQRCDIAFRPAFSDILPHVLFAIELSKGCSVGCGFCGLSAPSFKRNFLRTRANKVLFEGVLGTLAQFTGKAAAAWGFLYWATDPFDNPDYEAFCTDFAATFGRFPVTTTAQGLRDVSRTRNLIRLSARTGSRVRLTVLSLKMLNRFFEELTPQELESVDLIPLNKESLLAPAATGRARLKRPSEMRGGEEHQKLDTSIACVTGFLINMIDSNLKLIAPCESSARWPNGYYVFEEAAFRGVDELGTIVEGMINRHMPSDLDPRQLLLGVPEFEYFTVHGGFEVSSGFNSRRFAGNFLLGEIGHKIFQENMNANSIANDIEHRFGVQREATFDVIRMCFQAGLVNSTPSV